MKQDLATTENPYFAMFGQEDLSGVKEVLMWRQYVQGLGSGHDVALAADEGNWGVGVTRGFCTELPNGRMVCRFMHMVHMRTVMVIIWVIRRLPMCALTVIVV